MQTVQEGECEIDSPSPKEIKDLEGGNVHENTLEDMPEDSTRRKARNVLRETKVFQQFGSVKIAEKLRANRRRFTQGILQTFGRVRICFLFVCLR